MTDDAPANGTPATPGDRPAPEPGGQPRPQPGGQAGAVPDGTVVRPRDPLPTAPAGAIVSDPIDPGAAPADGPGPVPSADAADGGPPPPGADAAAPAPGAPQFPTRASRAGTTGAVVALGTGLLGAAILLSAIKARATDSGDLDWSNYGVGLGATAVLLVVAVVAALAGRRTGGRAREEAITWPGVAGIVGTGVMIVVGVEGDGNGLGYLVGGVVIVLSALGYVAARRAAFTVTGLLGLALIYALLFDDLLADRVDGDRPMVVAAAVVGVFVLVVTLLGWLLPSRAVTGVVVGAIGLVGYVGIMVSFLVTRYLFGFFGAMPVFGEGEGSGGMDGMSGAGGPFGEDGFRGADVWWVLAFAAVLTLLWALAAAVANHPGFSLLAIAAPTLLVPLAAFALAAEHPTRWSAVVATAGGVLLLGGVALARVRGRRTASELSELRAH